MNLDPAILGLAEAFVEAYGDVSARDIYAALPDIPSMHRCGKKEPSLAHIARVLQKNGYHPVGNTRGGRTRYRKGD